MRKSESEFAQEYFELIKNGEFDKGILYLEEFANKGYLLAQEELGKVFMFGYNGKYIDYNKAKLWFEESLKNGGIAGYYYLGNIYYRGSANIKRDVNHALTMFEQAGLHGISEALYSLGQIYYEGIDVPGNFKKAKEYFEQAHKQNDPMGSFGVGLVSLFDDTIDFEEFKQIKNYFEIASSAEPIEIQQQSITMINLLEKPIDIKKDSYKIWDIKELVEKLDKEHKTGYYYRGQTNGTWKPLAASLFRQKYSAYPINYSGKERLRNTGTTFYFQDINDYTLMSNYPESKKIQILLNDYVRGVYGYVLTTALFQQAGYQSEGLDITFDLFVALFFASNNYNKLSGTYQTVEKDDSLSVIYRWKNLDKPTLDKVMQANYFDCPNLIPTYEIFNSFNNCKTEQEFFQSLKEYGKAINYGTSEYDVVSLYKSKKRPFHLLKIPDNMFKNSRIYKQKAGLLIGDYIMTDRMNEYYSYQFDFDVNNYIKNSPLNLRQDLSGDDICETFYFKKDPELSEHILNQKQIRPNDLYDDSQLDFSHLFLNGWLEHRYDELHSYGTIAIDPGPRPDLGIDYYTLIQKLKELRKNRSNMKYYFS